MEQLLTFGQVVTHPIQAADSKHLYYSTLDLPNRMSQSTSLPSFIYPTSRDSVCMGSTLKQPVRKTGAGQSEEWRSACLPFALGCPSW